MVIQYRQITDQHHRHIRQPEIGRVGVGKLLQFPYQVVSQVAHQSGGERRQLGLDRGVQSSQGGLQHLQRTPGGR